MFDGENAVKKISNVSKLAEKAEHVIGNAVERLKIISSETWSAIFGCTREVFKEMVGTIHPYLFVNVVAFMYDVIF